MAKKKRGISWSDLNFWSSDSLLKNVPFFFFLGFLATIYIANSHFAERNVRKIQVLQREIKEMRWFYMSLQSENMFNSKRSEIAKKVAPDGLRQLNSKPKIIEVNR